MWSVLRLFQSKNVQQSVVLLNTGCLKHRQLFFFFLSAERGPAFITCAGSVSRSQLVLEDPFPIWGRNVDEGYHPLAAVSVTLCNELLCSPRTGCHYGNALPGYPPSPSPQLSLSFVQLCASLNRPLEMDYRTFSYENTPPDDPLPFL